MVVGATAVTQAGLPFWVPSLLPGPQPTTSSLVRLAVGTRLKPQSWTLFAVGSAPTVPTA